MEIDLFLEGAICGAVCFAEVFIGILATRKGRIFLLVTKVLGLILDGVVLSTFFKDGSVQNLDAALLILILWERVVMFFILGKKFCCCKLFKNVEADDTKTSRCSIHVHEKYIQYTELKAAKYEKNKQSNCCGCDLCKLSGKDMQKGLIALYYGALFNTTDYLGSIWKSDNDKYIIFGFFYLLSIVFISFMGFFVIAFSFNQPEFGFRVAVGMTLYLNALGVLQHWINFAVYLKRKCDSRDQQVQKKQKQKQTSGTVELQVNVQKNASVQQNIAEKLEYKEHGMSKDCCYYICCCCVFCCIRNLCCHCKVCLGNYICCFCRRGGCNWWCNNFCGCDCNGCNCKCGSGVGGCSSCGRLLKVLLQSSGIAMFLLMCALITTGIVNGYQTGIEGDADASQGVNGNSTAILTTSDPIYISTSNVYTTA